MEPGTEILSPRIATPPPLVVADATSMVPEFDEDPPIKPDKSRVIFPPAASPTSKTASPESKATFPPGAVIEPELSTFPPMRAANSSALIEPRFITEASESPLKEILPERNAESAISREDAINAWTSIWASEPNKIPFGLIK